jgi:tetratricopeptide (TPR) repeat protein
MMPSTMRNAMTGRDRLILAGVCLGLAAAVFAAYTPAIRGEFLWDDDFYVSENEHLHTLSGLGRVWFEPRATVQYYPLTFTTFWIEYHLWGLNPTGFHVVNVLLHIGNALLVYLLFRGLRIRWAAWAAFVFALHPVYVESVAWITERKNVLSGFLALLAVLAWMRFRPLGDRPANHRDRRGWYALAVVAFVAAMFSKTAVCVVPPAMLVLLWWRRGRLERRDVLATVPFFLVAIALGALTVWVEAHGGARGEEWDLSMGQRGLLAGRSAWFYAQTFLLPIDLSFVYPRWTIDPSDPTLYVYPAALVLVMLTLWAARRRIGRGPLAVALLYVGMLFPVLGFLNVYYFRYSYVADHFQYLPSLALVGGAAGLGALLWERGAASLRRGVRVAGVLVVAALGVATYGQSAIYRDMETLFTETNRRNPDSWMTLHNLANLYNEQGRYDEAVPYYLRALEVHPEHDQARLNLARLLRGLRRHSEAEEHIREAIRRRPRDAGAYYELGELLREMGRVDDALVAQQSSIELDATLGEPHASIGSIYLRQGRTAEALRSYTEAVRLRPDMTQAWHTIAAIHSNEGRHEQAAEALRAALNADPDNVALRTERAAALRSARLWRDSAEEYRECLRRAPNTPNAIAGLAWILAACPESTLRNGPQAVQLAELLVRSTGSQHPIALDVLGVALAEAGRFPEARDAARRALELAREQGLTDRADAIAARIEGYTQNRPFREPSAP